VGLHSTTGKFTQMLNSYFHKDSIFCGKNPKRAFAWQNRQEEVEVVCFPGVPKGEFWLYGLYGRRCGKVAGVAVFLKNFPKKLPAG
jgi:hypothetical protein